jgi:low density lipoprotein receptor-related protein 5/6
MVGGIVSSVVVCLLLFAVSLLVCRRLKRTPDGHLTHDIGLVVTPAMNNRIPSLSCSNSSHASLYVTRNGSMSSSKRLNLISNSTHSGTLHTAYDRDHLTGASSSSSACTVISAYPRETLNPPPSPVTERSLFSSRSRGYCDSVTAPSTCPSHRYYRAHMPPPPTPVSTDAESSVNHPLHRHHRRSHGLRSKKSNRYADSNCTDMAYELDLFAPPPTPNTNYLSEATHFSENECPPSPTITERSYFHPYPPPPSPVTDTPSLV